MRILAMRRALMWSFLISLAMASLETLTYFASPYAVAGMPFADFARMFACTSTLLLIITVVAWLFFHVLAVWLGGVRPGIALLFLGTFLIVYDFLVQTLDLLFTYMPKYAAERSTLITSAACFALAACAVTTLIIAKISRRRSISLSPRVFAILVAVLVLAAFANWARGAGFANVGGTTFWCVYAATAACAALIIWWLGKNPRRFGYSLLAMAIPVLAPFPWAFSTPSPSQALTQKANASGHGVKHIILITVDTLRRDALGCYNAKPESSPRIDQFAGDSVQFDNALSAAPWTCPAIASIMTGLTPRAHLVSDGSRTLPDKVSTLAERLASAGYRTGAVGLNNLLLPRAKFDRGFEEYNWFPRESFNVKSFDLGLSHQLLSAFTQMATATSITDCAIQWFKKNAQQDSFFWIHYFDPHMPYMPPGEYLPADPKLRKLGAHFWDLKAGRSGSAARTAEERAWVRSLYDGEVRYVDCEIGRLLDALRQIGIYDDALIVFTSDHGEEFWDHGRFEHGHTLFNELLQVPLLIKPPRNHQNVRIDSRVPTGAIASTLLDVCGIAPEAARGLMPPLTPLLRGSTADYPEQPVFSGAALFFEQTESVTFDGMKYIKGYVSGTEMLFNLNSDPHELNSIALQDPVNLEKGRQLLQNGITAADQLKEQLGIVESEQDRLDPQDVNALQALGYL
jgi:arylsulfatase A-like enzyme